MFFKLYGDLSVGNKVNVVGCSWHLGNIGHSTQNLSIEFCNCFSYMHIHIQVIHAEDHHVKYFIWTVVKKTE